MATAQIQGKCQKSWPTCKIMVWFSYIHIQLQDNQTAEKLINNFNCVYEILIFSNIQHLTVTYAAI